MLVVLDELTHLGSLELNGGDERHQRDVEGWPLLERWSSEKIGRA
jgi:hypothetical protein